jgi:hypothetical protein
VPLSNPDVVTVYVIEDPSAIVVADSAIEQVTTLSTNVICLPSAIIGPVIPTLLNCR